MTQTSTRSLSYIAIGAALIAVLSQIIIPAGPVPFTLQTTAVGLIASLYKSKEASLSVIFYLLLGAIGLPVFAGGSSGFQALFGATGGFLWGFILYGFVTGRLTNSRSSFLRLFVANSLGITLLLLSGAIYFKFFTQASWSDTLAWTITPFIMTSLLQILFIILVVKSLRPVLKKETFFQ